MELLVNKPSPHVYAWNNSVHIKIGKTVWVDFKYRWPPADVCFSSKPRLLNNSALICTLATRWTAGDHTWFLTMLQVKYSRLWQIAISADHLPFFFITIATHWSRKSHNYQITSEAEKKFVYPRSCDTLSARCSECLPVLVYRSGEGASHGVQDY